MFEIISPYFILLPQAWIRLSIWRLLFGVIGELKPLIPPLQT